jgi:hypothetical protein
MDITVFMALSINIMVCLPPSSGKLRREKQFGIGKGASKKHTAPSTIGEGHCAGTPPVHCSPLQFILLPFTQKQNFPPKSYQLPHKLHGVIHKKKIILKEKKNIKKKKKKRLRGCALDSFASG